MDSAQEPVAWIVHERTGDRLTTDGGYVANAEGIGGIHSTPLYAIQQPLTEAERNELQQSRRILAGLPQVAIDRGWTAAGASAHARCLEDELAAKDAELQQYRKAASEAVAFLWSHRKHESEVTLTRPEDDDRAEAALWSGWTCQPLAPVRPAPIGNEFIPKNLDRALGVLGMALPESKEEFYLQSERWIQRLIDRVIRYSDEFKAQPAPLEPIWAATKYPVSHPVPGAQLIVWDETGNFIGYGSSVDTRDSGVAIQMNDGRRLDSNHDLRWQYALQPAPVIPDGWVACSVRMPPDGFDVICTSEFDGPGDWRQKVGYWHLGKWVVYGASWTPTHWMPLPAAPQQEVK